MILQSYSPLGQSSSRLPENFNSKNFVSQEPLRPLNELNNIMTFFKRSSKIVLSSKHRLSSAPNISNVLLPIAAALKKSNNEDRFH